jgi:chemotaxis protein CheC
MVGEQVLLSVPSVEIISHKAAAVLIGEREGSELVAVRQNFSGAFSGRAMLIFPQSNSMELVRAVVGDEIDSADLIGSDLIAMESEALAETGNIILNGCLGSMANMLQRSLSMSLPEVLHSDGARLFQFDGSATPDSLVLFLYINFSIRDRDIRGYIAMLMDLPSLGALKLLIDDFIRRVMDDDAIVGQDGHGQ